MGGLRRGPLVAKRTGYDVFISYSHALDGRLAPVFQRELERFAKPWYRLQSLRVFRDNASLTANPGLWSSIEAGLGQARWFMLMASPEAASSRWVNREVEWWLEHRSADRLLIVLTSGELGWEEQAGDFDWSVTSALPPAFRGAVREEPRWIDLRWLRDAEQADPANPRLRDCVADVAAAVLEQPKDLLVGEHIRQHRRAVRLARSAVTALATLLVLVIVAALAAVGQRNTAVRDARIATAGELAALASSDLGSHFDQAQLLAVQAYQMNPDSQTRDALFRAVTASPNLVRYLPAGVRVTALSGAKNGHVIVAGTADGNLLYWNLANGIRGKARAGQARITAIAISAGGERVVATDGAGTYLWNPGAEAHPRPIYAGPVLSVAISPSGRTVAVLGGKLFSTGKIVIVDGGSGRELRTSDQVKGPDEGALNVGLLAGSYVGLPDDRTVVLDSGTGTWSRLPVATLVPVTAGGQMEVPGDLHYCCGYSVSGNYFAWSKYGDVVIVNEKPGRLGQKDPAEESRSVATPLQEPDQFAVSEDGMKVAVAGGDALYVASVSGRAEQLPGTGGVTALAFLGDGQRLVSASGTAVVLWDLSQVSRIVAGPVANAPDGSNVGVPPQIAFSPDGKRVAITGETFRPFVLQQLGTSQLADTVVSAPEPAGGPGHCADINCGYAPLPLWSADGQRLLLLGDNGAGDGALQWSGGSRFSAVWPTASARWGSARGQVLAARISPDDQRIVLVDSYGDIQVRSAADGAIRRAIRGIKQNIVQDPPQNEAAISQDTATAAVVLPGGIVRVTDINSGRHHNLPASSARAVSFGSGNLLVENQDNSLDVWNPAGTRLYRSIPGDAIFARGMTAIPYSQLVARVTEQGAVVLSDLGSGQVIGSLALPNPTRSSGEPPWDATTVAASPDGRTLITATASGSAVRWQLSPDAWVHAACAAAGRDLTPAEWRLTVGTTPPAELACRR